MHIPSPPASTRMRCTAKPARAQYQENSLTQKTAQDQSDSHAGTRLHAPEIVILLGVMFRHGIACDRASTEFRGVHGRKRFRNRFPSCSLIAGSRGKRNGRNISVSRRSARARRAELADHIEEVMILDMLDLIGQHHKAAINFVEFTAFKGIAELLTSDPQCVPPGMFA